MEILEKKILEAISSIDNFVPVGMAAAFVPDKALARVMPIINQAMRENAVEFAEFIHNKWILYTNIGHSKWFYCDEFHNVKTPEQLHDLFMEFKTKSK